MPYRLTRKLCEIKAGRSKNSGWPPPAERPAGRLAAWLAMRCQRPARIKFGPARMGPALGRAASQGGRGAGRAAGQPAGPAIQVCELSGGYLCLRLATRLSHGGLAGWQSERPAAGRAAGHAEKASGHLVKSGWPDGITRLKPYFSSSSCAQT